MAGVVIQKAKERSSCNVEDELTWTQHHYSETTLCVELGQGLIEGDLRGDDLRVRITMTGHRSPFPSFLSGSTRKVVEEPQPVQPESLDWSDDDSQASTAASSSTMTMKTNCMGGAVTAFKKVKKHEVLTVELLKNCGLFTPFKTLGSAEVIMSTLPKECFVEGNGAASDEVKQGKLVRQRLRLGNAGLLCVELRFTTTSILQTKQDWDMVVADGPP